MIAMAVGVGTRIGGIGELEVKIAGLKFMEGEQGECDKFSVNGKQRVGDGK